MANDLRDLLRESAAAPEPTATDLGAVVATGRRRVRRRRVAVVGGTALAVGALSVAGYLALPNADRPDSAGPPGAGTVTLDDAVTATEGTDFRVLATVPVTSGRGVLGVTEDGLAFVENGGRFGLSDPATGKLTRLPAIPGSTPAEPMLLGSERLVLWRQTPVPPELRHGTMVQPLEVWVLDRGDDAWSRVTWPRLPKVEGRQAPVLGADGRLYVVAPGPDTQELWSVSLTDSSDVRNERQSVALLTAGDGSLAWTDDADVVHVRDLDSGETTAFRPDIDPGCEAFSLLTAGDHLALDLDCGAASQVLVLEPDGDRAATLEHDGSLVAAPTAPGGPAVVMLHSEDPRGVYSYDVDTGRLLRLWADESLPTPVPAWTRPGQVVVPAPSEGAQQVIELTGE